MTFGSVMRTLRALTIPEGVLVTVAAMVVEWQLLGASEPAAARFALPGLLVAGTLLAWRFHRGSVVLALATLALAHVALQMEQTGSEGAFVVHQALGVVLPLNLAGLAILPQRGLTTGPGFLRWSALGLEALAVVLLAYPTPAPAAHLLMLEAQPAEVFGWSALNAVALGGFALGATVLATGAALHPNASARGFLWALVGCFLALQAPNGTVGSLYLATAALVLVVALVEASYSMAYRDGLTGLPGRRAFDEALARLGTRYAVAMVDVDHFKRVNDRFGHDVGDQVLRLVATKLGSVGGGGRAYRYGGEEFALLFPGKTTDDTLPLVEAIRAAVEEEPFAFRGANRPKDAPKPLKRSRRKKKDLEITVSAGVADCDRRGVRPSEVVQAADAALYRAKQRGRNRVVVE